MGLDTKNSELAHKYNKSLRANQLSRSSHSRSTEGRIDGRSTSWDGTEMREFMLLHLALLSLQYASHRKPSLANVAKFPANNSFPILASHVNRLQNPQVKCFGWVGGEATH